jgi:hypothetical protein
MNKLAFSIAVLVTFFMVIPIFGVTIQLEIIDVSSSTVNGSLTITNNANTPVTWDFPSSGQFDLWVDGTGSAVCYFDILTSFTVPANSTIVIGVSHISFTPLGSGEHTAQARFVLSNSPPAGAPVTFQYGTTLNDVNDLSYDLGISSVNVQYVTGILTMHNNNDAQWQMGFPNLPVAEIRVDGNRPEVFYIPMSYAITIDPWGTHTEDVEYYTSTPLAVGSHVAQVHLLCNGEPAVGNPVTFNIAPSATADPLQVDSPHPFRECIKIASDSQKPVSITIYNLKGQSVTQAIVTSEYVWDGKDTKGIACNSGIYFVKAVQGNKSTLQKVVKL